MFAIRCIADSNSGATTDGFLSSGTAGSTAINCVAYNNGRDGIRIGDDCNMVQNCIAESNVAIGIDNTNQDSCVLINNATFGNATGINVGTGKGNLNLGAVAGSGSFFVDAPNQNFALNNTGGAGAAARAAGFPGVLSIGGAGYLDIGVLQHADPAGGGGLLTHPGMAGGMRA
jgi:parallel beta-helix repeat protein